MEKKNNALCIAVLKRFANTTTVLVKVYRPFSEEFKFAYTDSLSLEAVGLPNGGVIADAKHVSYVPMLNAKGEPMYTECENRIPLNALRIKL